MNMKYLLGIGLAVATAVAACGGGNDPNALGNGDPTMGGTSGSGGTGKNGSSGSNNGGSTGSSTTPSDPGTNTTPQSPQGQAFYVANVHPFLAASCGGCHDTAGPGPNWIIKSDANATYKLLFQLGYVTTDSRILNKGPHGGVTTNVLTDAQKSTYLQWVSMEQASGLKTTPDVLSKLGACLDQTKFLAIGLGNIRTIQRTNNNNTNNVTGWAENANRCTGCNNAPCRDCHTGDQGSGFVNAIGYPGQINGQTSDVYTFEQTKLTNPVYLQHYFGLSPSGDPVASHAIEAKSTATSKDKAYTHPYFTLTTAQVAAIQAFTDDAIAKYKAGTCTGTPAPTTTQ